MAIYQFQLQKLNNKVDDIGPLQAANKLHKGKVPSLHVLNTTGNDRPPLSSTIGGHLAQTERHTQFNIKERFCQSTTFKHKTSCNMHTNGC